MERRSRIVLNTELDSLGHLLAGDVGHHAKTKVDSRRNAASGDHITVLHNSCLLISGSDERQEFGKSPMRGGAASLQYPSHTEDKGPGTH